MKLKALLLVLAAAGALPLAAQADIGNGNGNGNGKALYSKDCMSCHRSIAGGDGSSLFTRPNRHVTSLGGLDKQVKRCRANTGLSLSDNQLKDIVDYLNATYYKFAK